MIGAENLGYVSDRELLDLYRGAIFTLSPSTVEFYGYALVESVSCGTPSLAFNNAGVVELNEPRRNGWLAKVARTLSDKAVELYTKGYDDSIRKNCLNDSAKNDIEHSTYALLSGIRDL